MPMYVTNDSGSTSRSICRMPFSFVRLVCRLRKARIPEFQRSSGRVPQASEFHLLCWTRLNCSCSLSYFAPTSRFASSFCLLPKMKSESYGTKAKAKSQKKSTQRTHESQPCRGPGHLCLVSSKTFSTKNSTSTASTFLLAACIPSKPIHLPW